MAQKKSKRKNGGTGEPIYRETFIEQARVACLEFGATDVQLGKLFGVTAKSVREWKKSKPGFAEAVQEGKDRFDSLNVEKALLNRALGYDYYEVTEEASREADAVTGQAKMIVTKRVKKHVYPDVGAASIWLFNRHPDRWKNPRHQVEHTGKVETEVKYTEFPKEPQTLAEWEKQRLEAERERQKRKDNLKVVNGGKG